MLKNFIQATLQRFGYSLRATHHFGDHYWNDLETLMARQPSQNPIIIDVGAHHGETLLACRNAFPTAMIHCFEPDPESQDILAKCAADLAQVKLHPVALGAASLVSEYAGFTKTQVVIQVPVETLDSVCQRENIPWIDLLKTDCQGFDLMVLQGAEKMISSHQVGLITCEVIFDQEYDGQGKFYELLKFLDDRGYQLIGFYNMSRTRGNVCTYCDVIFSKPTRQS